MPQSDIQYDETLGGLHVTAAGLFDADISRALWIRIDDACKAHKTNLVLYDGRSREFDIELGDMIEAFLDIVKGVSGRTIAMVLRAEHYDVGVAGKVVGYVHWNRIEFFTEIEPARAWLLAGGDLDA